MNNITINENKDLNGIEISFISKPDKEYLDLLKSNGFRWHRAKKLWYAKNNSKSRSVVEQIKDNDDLLKFEGTKKVDGYLGASGFQGSNNHLNRTLTSKERNALIKKEFRKNFPAFTVSIRQGKGGCLDAVNIYLTVSHSKDILTLEEFSERFSDLPSFAKFGALEMNESLDDNIDACNKDRKAYIKNRFEKLVKFNHECILSDQATNAMNWLRKSFDSFNSDKSNGMADYFDRDIYDFYEYKWID